MNARARALGLDDTSYANPIGLDDPLNYSSARDLAALARRLLRDERFAAIVEPPVRGARVGRAAEGGPQPQRPGRPRPRSWTA